MADDNTLVEIDNLYVNFYTYQGVVKAIDGIDLEIKNGETLGIVGETGCGKSVTASTIMKLILSPPGKIESGAIYFMEPPDVRAARKQAELDAQTWYENLPPGERAKVVAEYGMRFTGFKKDRKALRSDGTVMPVPNRIPTGVLAAHFRKKLEKVPKDDKVMQEAIGQKYDLLPKSNEYMQLIRGRFISMIFQEPTAALNPVFTAGDQIAEVILQHRKSDMAKRARLAVYREQWLTETGRIKKTLIRKGKMIDKKLDGQDPPAGWKPKQTYRTRMLDMIEKNPHTLGNIMDRIPLVRRIPYFNQHNKDIYNQGIIEATRMLDIVRIPDPEGVVNRYPYELSGGMQQRVMIAMALACNPKLLIADEPTTALDVTIQAQILKLMRELKETYGSSILLITHNLGVVAEMCDRVGVMYAGSMAEIGASRTIFKKPLHPYTKGLMSAVPSVQKDTDTLFTIRGSVPNLVKPPPGCRFHPRCDYAKEFCKKVKPGLKEIEPGHMVACHMVTGAKGYE